MNAATHPPARSTDEQCADCARTSGCKPCFEELVRRFQSSLLHFLLRRTSSRHDAEDLVQEAFLLAYRNLSRYRSKWRFSTWLFTIANRLAASDRRRQRPNPADVNAPNQSMASPFTDAQDSEMRSRLWDIARRILGPDAFTALWLNYVESMPAAEIGLVLGRNANAVRILLHRSRARLAQELSHE